MGHRGKGSQGRKALAAIHPRSLRRVHWADLTPLQNPGHPSRFPLCQSYRRRTVASREKFFLLKRGKEMETPPPWIL